MIRYTLWPSLYDTTHPTEAIETWESIVVRASKHASLLRKEDSAGFGPYRMHPGAVHRRDASVAEMTLLVFDADAATSMDEVHACVGRIQQAGVAQHWSSTYRFDGHEYLGFRLLLPISRPVAPEDWPSFRRSVLARYQIPAKVEQCSGKSHYYHLPSCPPGATPLVISRPGAPLEVATVPQAPQAPKPTLTLGTFEPPEEPTAPVDVTPLLQRLRDRATALRRRTTDNDAPRKAQLLERVLAGAPLAGPRERNNATTSATALMVYALPSDTPLSVLMHIVGPSVQAMIDEGSSLTEREVEGMVLRAMQRRWEGEELQRQVVSRLEQQEAALRRALVVHDPRRR